MRAIKLIAVLSIFVLSFSALCLAGALNKFGVADMQQLTLSEPTAVAGVVLPKGEYKVEHTMQGEDHIMVFTQLRVSTPATAKAKCQLVKLASKADRTQIMYERKGDTRVLQEMIFRGETAKHVF
jgi:hypothetical protein